MEEKKKNRFTVKKIIARSAAAIAILALAYYIYWIFVGVYNDAYSIGMEIPGDGWERHITYSMLSKKLKTIISEEEFNDSSPEGRYEMYRKLENLILDDRERFDGSTEHWKTPLIEYCEKDGTEYWVYFRIDLVDHLFYPEVVNFCCYFYPIPDQPITFPDRKPNNES